MASHVNFKINIKKKFIVNGREYGSEAEMPPEIRTAYEKAVHGGLASNIKVGSSPAKVVFNGQEYGTMADMPAEVRRIYEGAMAAIQKEDIEIDRHEPEKEILLPKMRREGNFPGVETWGKDGIKPSSVNWKIWGVGLAVVIILAAVYALT